ncbi:hypothetical protein CDQ71_00145 [Campylobacter hyointestinalis subsp. hyointestinalis]|uniref:DUF2335 domain-containing protein n=1 Tax=Campylobacter hyointestinalis subsp. hyointestinalis TaxID=91352 RepID=A0A9W5AWX4_CAMHY|nr:DUF2335 domain-containing protein [Campylobacter hyointestinalis]PPB58742.1 hypothetical protein CDQ71_00145 [Campylobacter hyointestinalis subsp. hyointestinalis]CUU77420.1 Uncharacterised protein [Campylobacter hyointestinalis subsp. hyointestinalis]CUU92482.1 Uncharacterised protein [Campylobacter hyointestinalis subsp. hyointestinalis]
MKNAPKKLNQYQKDSNSKQSKAVQNNLNINNINIIPSELDTILRIKPEYANEIMEYIKKEQQHRHLLDNNIVNLEQKEQQSRLDNIPIANRYTFIGQALAFILLSSALAIIAYAIYNHETEFSIVSVLGALGLSLYHISGKRKR